MFGVPFPKPEPVPLFSENPISFSSETSAGKREGQTSRGKAIACKRAGQTTQDAKKLEDLQVDADELEDLQVDADEPDDLQDYAGEDGSNTQGCYPHAEKMDDALDESDDENGSNTQGCYPRPTKSGSGLAGKILSTLMISASAIADAAQQCWTNVVRHAQVDLAEV